jgi:DNA gyrase subunit A
VPQAKRTAKGIPVVNLLNLDKGETISSMISVDDASEFQYFFFVTKNGLVKRVHIDEFESIRQTGKIAIRLNNYDELVAVRLTSGDEEIIIAGSNGKAVRFNEDNIRVMGRNAAGVIGFKTDGSRVIGMTTDRFGDYLLAVTEKGYGKKTEISEYRLTNRGVKGVKTINITEKNGELVSLKAVNGDEELLIITDHGQVIRIPVDDIGTYGRNTQGVRCITVDDDTAVSSVVVVPKDDEEELEHD